MWILEMEELFGFPWWLSGKESTCQCRRQIPFLILIWEDPTCWTAKPLCHNCWAWALEPGSHNYRACVPQLLKSLHPRVRALQQGKPPQWEAWAQLESRSCLLQLEKSPCSSKHPMQPQINKLIDKIIFKKLKRTVFRSGLWFLDV